jgi:tetratricopeptide (TPR) repeat protein
VSPTSLNKKLQKARDLLKSRQFVQALNLYATVADKLPRGNGEYGSAAAMSGDLSLADRLWEKLRKREPKNTEVLRWLANEYELAGLYAKSRWLWNEAANLEPGKMELQINLASFLVRANSDEESRPVVNRCLELDPRNEQARYLSAHLDRRQDKLAEAEKQLRELLASDVNAPQLRYAFHLELARVLDRSGRYDEAMTQLEDGKSFLRTALNAGAEEEALREQFQNEVRKITSLPKDILNRWGNNFPPRARLATPPVAFLSGVARSGTTLMEKVLDAHPAVAACDESLAFERIQNQFDFAAPILPAPRLNALRQLYVNNLAAALGGEIKGKLLLDKNPSRIMCLPGFLRVFPELRVVIGLRDPRDVIVSIYYHEHPGTNYLTFEQLAQRYSLLMDVWLAVREWEGFNWIETRYEDLVADLEGEGGRITKFLGLEWDKRQARYYEHNQEKPILSNNAADVARPVYRRAVGRWRAYEKQLAPIMSVLEPYCKKLGYA